MILEFLINILVRIVFSKRDNFDVAESFSIRLKSFESVKCLILIAKQMHSDDVWLVISKSHIMSMIWSNAW
jgi:hypothetical protein